MSNCQSNARNIAAALEMWFVDHDGHYPTALAELVPNYLHHVPDCPTDYHPDAARTAYSLRCTASMDSTQGAALFRKRAPEG